MKSKHDESEPPEHRIIVNLTPLEAALYLRRQPVVEGEVRHRIREALRGCDQAPKKVTADGGRGEGDDEEKPC